MQRERGPQLTSTVNLSSKMMLVSVMSTELSSRGQAQILAVRATPKMILAFNRAFATTLILYLEAMDGSFCIQAKRCALS